MWLRLEDVTKELNEKKWRLSWRQRDLREFDALLKAEQLKEALSFLEKIENKGLLDREAVVELLREILELEAEKTDLEQKLRGIV